ncbi:hypothetical protein SDC9_125684 [bioreactor metagenome]|uniref:Uncharacterized protein n=1 Tax=bioreactor metagenome TaxID=1076179 RepID=A0A645CP16_9ZZZZ
MHGEADRLVVRQAYAQPALGDLEGLASGLQVLGIELGDLPAERVVDPDVLGLPADREAQVVGDRDDQRLAGGDPQPGAGLLADLDRSAQILGRDLGQEGAEAFDRLGTAGHEDPLDHVRGQLGSLGPLVADPRAHRDDLVTVAVGDDRVVAQDPLDEHRCLPCLPMCLSSAGSAAQRGRLGTVQCRTARGDHVPVPGEGVLADPPPAAPPVVVLIDVDVTVALGHLGGAAGDQVDRPPGRVAHHGDAVRDGLADLDQVVVDVRDPVVIVHRVVILESVDRPQAVLHDEDRHLVAVPQSVE